MVSPKHSNLRLDICVARVSALPADVVKSYRLDVEESTAAVVRPTWIPETFEAGQEYWESYLDGGLKMQSSHHRYLQHYLDESPCC